MNTAPDDWTPEPELLAAYFDGELGGSPEDAALRQRVREWLHGHPEAREVLADYRRLRTLWRDTTPPDPGLVAWDEIATQLDLVLPARPRRRWGGAMLAAAAALALAVSLGLTYRLASTGEQAKQTPRPPVEDMEVLPVATAAEVVILRVEGADTQSLVVGELPVGGPLELAGPGDVALTSVQPDARDRMLPHVRMDGPRAPLIWAAVAPETMEP